MSYILDALRKSDQQRQRGAAPTLQSAQFMAVSAPEPPPRWFYVVLVAVLAGAAFVIGWARPWQTEAPRAGTIVLTPAAPAPRPSASPDSVTLERLAPATRKPPSAAPRRHPRGSIAPQSAPAGASKREASRAAATAGQAKLAPEKPAHAGNASGPPDEKIPRLAELPASLRQEIPQMTITVHAYSRTPKDRLVGVNDRLLHEGDALAAGLVLEKITPDGMIFSYKGTRFRHAVQ